MSYVGVDWADSRWIAVAVDGQDATVTTAPTILTVWHEFHEDADAFLVDVPIGLPAETGGRACDRTASTFLGERSSSVFSVPCREAVEADDYETAREASGGSLSSQSWWLFPRIREVDVFLQTVDEATDVVYEGHPEVCFAAYADGTLSSKSGQEGLRERLDVLADLDPAISQRVENVVDERGDAEWHHRITGGRRDDVLDAAVLAATARDVGLGSRSGTGDYPALPDGEDGYPDDPECDPVLDIPMEIVFPGREPDGQ